MSNFAPLYSPIKHFAPISLTNQSRNFPRPIYKPPPLNHNNMMNRTAFGQGIKTDFVPNSLTVPHVNQFNTSVIPNNLMNIQPFNKLMPIVNNNNMAIPNINNIQPPISQRSVGFKGNMAPRIVVPVVSNNSIANQSVIGSNNNINPINNLRMVNINTPNQITPITNLTPIIQQPKIINVTPQTSSLVSINVPQTSSIKVNMPQTTSVINVNLPQNPNIINVPQPSRIINANPPQSIFPTNNIPISNFNNISYQNSFLEPGEQIDLKEYELLGEIGKGSFGKIYKVKWKVNQKYYALKAEVLDDEKDINTRLNRGRAMRNFVQSTGCQGVVNILGSYQIKRGRDFHYFELMELCEGDFEQEIKLRSNFGSYYSEGELDNIIKQLISTLSFLQKRHITHRDIKPQNILISNGKYKLCDFGDIRVMQRDGLVIQRIRGSELYMSPILFNALRRGLQQVEHNTYKSDVFSLGMCLFYAACLSFDGPVEIREINDMNMKMQILNKYLSARYSQKLIRIFYLMLLTEESDRPDFIQLENAILKYGL